MLFHVFRTGEQPGEEARCGPSHDSCEPAPRAAQGWTLEGHQSPPHIGFPTWHVGGGHLRAATGKNLHAGRRTEQGASGGGRVVHLPCHREWLESFGLQLATGVLCPPSAGCKAASPLTCRSLNIRREKNETRNLCAAAVFRRTVL